MDHDARADFHRKFEKALSFVCRLHGKQSRNVVVHQYVGVDGSGVEKVTERQKPAIPHR